MKLQESQIAALMEISEAVYRNPPPEELSQILATKVCPTGEITRVYIGRLDSDGIIRTVSSFGYSLDSKVMEITTPIEFDRPMPHAMRIRQVIVANKEDVLKKYQNYEPLDLRSPWISTAVVPTLGKLAFVFRLQCRIEHLDSAELYFRMMATSLNFYDHEGVERRDILGTSMVGQNLDSRNSRENLRGLPLTERQELIVDLIKQSKTNIQIANSLGYSESLIRQETIVIYAKLGVNGRRELSERSEILTENSYKI